ncbi:MAG TPA: cellulase family glycosylhydrolase [Planctomycetota bacterium]
MQRPSFFGLVLLCGALAIPAAAAEDSVPLYGRLHKEFDAKLGVERVEFTGPDGVVESRPAFAHQPGEFTYDRHGYEILKPKGAVMTAVRFTPTKAGAYKYRAMKGDAAVAEGTFPCAASENHGYVEVSKKDPRYFALSDGTSYCAIGTNLCWPAWHTVRPNKENAELGGRGTLGANEYRHWFEAMSKNGGNFARLWVGWAYFDAQTPTAGEMDLLMFNRLDKVVELARQNGVRLKFCMDAFRSVKEGGQNYRLYKNPADGKPPKDMAEFFTGKTWRELWLKKIRAYGERYGGDPTVAVWELWNEINAAEGGWENQREWTKYMLKELQKMFPKQLVVNSLGSFDSDWSKPHYNDFKMDEMPFQQVHRYLDQGAGYEICRTDPVAFSIDAVNQTRRPDRPVLLAETGGVNDNHAGPFRYYRGDHRSIIFNDTTFPAFFAGAAGTGHIWHWDLYVDEKNAWQYFKPFSNLIVGIQLDAEDFQAKDLSTKDCWVLCLKGKQHTLAWVRNKADSWHAVLRDFKEPGLIENAVVDLGSIGVTAGQVKTEWPWSESTGAAKLENGKLTLPAFRYGVMVRIDGK